MMMQHSLTPEILSQVETNDLKRSGLPTWIPDWRLPLSENQAAITMMLETSRVWLYSASRSSRHDVQLISDRELSVMGGLLDEIASVDEWKMYQLFTTWEDTDNVMSILLVYLSQKGRRRSGPLLNSDRTAGTRKLASICISCERPMMTRIKHGLRGILRTGTLGSCERGRP
jgi:hypothetical protein